MSNTFHLVCDETKKRVWIGQGWAEMTTLYSGEKDTMEKLRKFLNDHSGKNMRMANCNDEKLYSYKEY